MPSLIGPVSGLGLGAAEAFLDAFKRTFSQQRAVRYSLIARLLPLEAYRRAVIHRHVCRHVKFMQAGCPKLDMSVTKECPEPDFSFLCSGHGLKGSTLRIELQLAVNGQNCPIETPHRIRGSNAPIGDVDSPWRIRHFPKFAPYQTIVAVSPVFSIVELDAMPWATVAHLSGFVRWPVWPRHIDLEERPQNTCRRNPQLQLASDCGEIPELTVSMIVEETKRVDVKHCREGNHLIPSAWHTIFHPTVQRRPLPRAGKARVFVRPLFPCSDQTIEAVVALLHQTCCQILAQRSA